MDYGINREYRDRLFVAIFGSEKRKEFTLSLYNALNETNYTDINDLQLTTIDGIIYMGMRNDVSFILGGYLNMYEHQSTWNQNMPLRYLLYITQQYNRLLVGNERKIFSSRLLKIPTPRFVVF